VVAIDLIAWVTICATIVAALVAVLGALGYQNRRARLSAIRSAFNEVVVALASTDREQQLAGAVLLRRFFDATSELGARDPFRRPRAPYEAEALSVLAAVLRGMPSGDVQKLLADGLRHASTLEGADLQRTNLHDAYLSPRGPNATLERADFYRADLGGTSLRSARAAGAQFYQARLHGTILRDADLRGANFFQADLSGANFAGASLFGASFAEARNVPAELREHLADDGTYESHDPAPAPTTPTQDRPTVFLSLPSERTAAQDARCERISDLLTRDGVATEVLPRREYPGSGALGEILRRLSGCSGIVVFGLQPADGEAARSSVGSTPWTHLEAGMAYACRLPMLIVREPGVTAGVFDGAIADQNVHVLDLEPWNDERVQSATASWVLTLSAR
jgi:uncharacterized protein YjbI with pentapeptide repeats